jgi:integrase
VVVMARRSYGTGQLFVRADSNGRETWYGSWRVGGRRVKRRVGLKRRPSTSDGLTRTQAEAELRWLMGTEVVLAGPQRKTIEEAGALYVEHLEHVMERKRTTIHDYRGYLRRHLVPFFGARPMDKIDRAFVENYLLAKKREGLSSKTVCNHLNFLHGPVVVRDQARVGAEPGRAGRPSADAAVQGASDPVPHARGARRFSESRWRSG